VCGIAGVAGFRLEEATVLDQVGLLHHRGPDSFGVHHGSGATVAQTRLAIIDLVTGDPPITNEDRTIGVALNGEIYNFRALRGELRDGGHDLKTEGDTEVIAHLAEDHEPVALCRRLDGMFAFALWDDSRRRLVLGRDRLGKKPLYYWQGAGGDVVFGSEIKAVLSDPRVPRQLASGAVDAYLSFGYVPTPHTFFSEVRSVPPGHVLVASPGREPEVLAYWEPRAPGSHDVEPVTLSFDEAGAEVRRLLTDAVGKRLVADVPLGAFLSGGVDSSAVVALMARLSPRPVKTFTIGFEDLEGFDERPFARQVSQRFGTEHTEFVVNPDKAELIERLVWHHDQPFADSSALPTFLLSELTRRHVTVALSGDGASPLLWPSTGSGGCHVPSEQRRSERRARFHRRSSPGEPAVSTACCARFTPACPAPSSPGSATSRKGNGACCCRAGASGGRTTTSAYGRPRRAPPASTGSCCST